MIDLTDTPRVNRRHANIYVLRWRHVRFGRTTDASEEASPQDGGHRRPSSCELADRKSVAGADQRARAPFTHVCIRVRRTHGGELGAYRSRNPTVGSRAQPRRGAAYRHRLTQEAPCRSRGPVRLRFRSQKFAATDLNEVAFDADLAVGFLSCFLHREGTRSFFVPTGTHQEVISSYSSAGATARI